LLPPLFVYYSYILTFSFQLYNRHPLKNKKFDTDEKAKEKCLKCFA